MTDAITAKQAIRDLILAEYRKGNIVYASIEGPITVPVAEFIQQPTSGILYDLNRLPEVVLTNLDDVKWVNDYAVAMVISALKAKIDDLEVRLCIKK